MQLPMYFLWLNQIMIITGVHPLVQISRTVFLWLKIFYNDFKDSSVIPFLKKYDY